MDRQAVVRHEPLGRARHVMPPHACAKLALIAVAAPAAGWLMIGLPLMLRVRVACGARAARDRAGRAGDAEPLGF